MKIGISVDLGFNGKRFTGITRSVYEIIKVWMKDHPEHEYYLFSRYYTEIEMGLQFPSNWHIITRKEYPWVIDKGKLWDVFMIPKLIKELKLDIYWGTNYVLPYKVTGVKYYITIYDLALFKFKNIGERKNTIRLKLFTKKACIKADGIIAISKSTEQDLIKIFHINKNKIHISYCGGLPTDYNIENKNYDKVNPTLKFDESYFLFISTIEPRKNVITLIKAFEQYIEKTGNKTKLVLAGNRGWKCDGIYKAIRKSNCSHLIVVPGYVSDIDKGYLLSNAIAFVYPSLYEGFGIPILEAYAYGLPVITTNVSSLPEVAGNPGFYIENPVDSVELEKKMELVYQLTHEQKEKLKKKMYDQMKKFSWKKNADEMLKIITRVDL